MKVALSAVATVFSAAFAAPAAKRSEHDIIVSIHSSGNGKTVMKGIPLGGYKNSIAAVFRGSDIDVNGRITASIITLGDNKLDSTDVTCYIQFGDTTRQVTNWTPWLNLGGINSKDGTPVDVTDGTIACNVAGETPVVEFA